MCNKSRKSSKFSPYSMAGTPLLLKVGGAGGRTFQKLSHLGGDTKNFARKGGGLMQKWGVATFYYFKVQLHLLSVCVCVCVYGGGVQCLLLH